MSAAEGPSLTAPDNPNRQSNSLASMTSSGVVSSTVVPSAVAVSSAAVPPVPIKRVRVSPRGSFAVPISVDSQEDNRRVTFANDAYRRETPCTACCRSCMRCCGWIARCSCCRSGRPDEVTKYVDEHGSPVPDDDEAQYGYGAEASFWDFDNDPRERDTSSAMRKCCRKELMGIKIRHWSYLLCLLAVAAFLSFYLCQWNNSAA